MSPIFPYFEIKRKTRWTDPLPSGAKVALIQMEPFADRSIGWVMPFYGYIKALCIAYLLLTRPSVRPLFFLLITPHSNTIRNRRAVQSSTNPSSTRVSVGTHEQSISPLPSSSWSRNGYSKSH